MNMNKGGMNPLAAMMMGGMNPFATMGGTNNGNNNYRGINNDLGRIFKSSNN